MTQTPMIHGLLGTGTVRHERLRPVRNAFAYPAFFVLLPLRAWRADPAVCPLPRNRAGAICFRDSDHGEGGPDALAWIESLLAAEGIAGCDGEIWLQCFPRVLGHAFKPVSFWYCHGADGQLRAIVAEVNNTFGERHCYVLQAPAWGRELRAAKAFHVSPFCSTRGEYRFRFLLSQQRERVVARIDYDEGGASVLQTSISGALQPMTRAALRHALLRQPFLTLGIVLRIHWQALRLWMGGVPFRRKPAPPDRFVTR